MTKPLLIQQMTAQTFDSMMNSRSNIERHKCYCTVQPFPTTLLYNLQQTSRARQNYQFSQDPILKWKTKVNSKRMAKLTPCTTHKPLKRPCFHHSTDPHTIRTTVRTPIPSKPKNEFQNRPVTRLGSLTVRIFARYKVLY